VRAAGSNARRREGTAVAAQRRPEQDRPRRHSGRRFRQRRRAAADENDRAFGSGAGKHPKHPAGEESAGRGGTSPGEERGDDQARLDNRSSRLQSTLFHLFLNHLDRGDSRLLHHFLRASTPLTDVT